MFMVTEDTEIVVQLSYKANQIIQALKSLKQDNVSRGESQIQGSPLFLNSFFMLLEQNTVLSKCIPTFTPKTENKNVSGTKQKFTRLLPLVICVQTNSYRCVQARFSKPFKSLIFINLRVNTSCRKFRIHINCGAWERRLKMKPKT